MPLVRMISSVVSERRGAILSRLMLPPASMVQSPWQSTTMPAQRWDGRSTPPEAMWMDLYCKKILPVSSATEMGVSLEISNFPLLPSPNQEDAAAPPPPITRL